MQYEILDGINSRSENAELIFAEFWIWNLNVRQHSIRITQWEKPETDGSFMYNSEWKLEMGQKSHWRNNSWELLPMPIKPDQDNQNKTLYWYFPLTWLRNKTNIQCKSGWLLLSYMQVAKARTVPYLSQSNIHINNVLEYKGLWKKSNPQFSI